MEAFFEAYDLTHLMCAELADDEESLYALARTSRALFKPSISYLWRNIDSFEPLLACLLPNSWSEARPSRIFSNEHTIVLPNGDFTHQDLERYLRYAPYIRNIHLKHTRKMKSLSSQLLGAFQWVLGFEQGVLSPNLTSFAWLPDLDPWLGPIVLQQIPSTLSLFLGDRVRSLKFTVGRDLDILTVLSTSGRPSNLQHLTFLGGPNDPLTMPLTSYPWAKLESISLTAPSASAIPHLARLPRLSTIHVKYMRDLEQGPVANTVASDPSSFRALREIGIHGNELSYAAKFFSYLPPSNSVHYAHCSTSSPAPPEDCNASIDILQRHLNPSELTCLEVRDLVDDGSSSFSGGQMDADDEVEGYHEAIVDISPLFKFTNLRTLFLSVYPRALVTPTDAQMIPKSWPNIAHLDLCGSLPIGRPPSVDYAHLLQVVEGCKTLQVLGLPFDSAQLYSIDKLTVKSPSVESFRVCGSPLHPDTGQWMKAMLRKTLPRLKTLDTAYQPWLHVMSESDTLWRDTAEEMELEVTAP